MIKRFFLAALVCGLMLSGGSYLMAKTELATFAGGCFWCMEKPFESISGVKSVISGYTGGSHKDPSYGLVSSGDTLHLEAVQIEFDPSIISYNDLLDLFWRQIDPTDDKGQFVDRGTQYTTAIFYHSDTQKQLAETSKRKLDMSGRYKRSIQTRILKAMAFYPAEDYHQDYYKKNPLRYKLYRANSGRDAYLKKIWGKEPEKVPNQKNKQALQELLSPMQYKVTQEDGTEPAFKNEYWDHKEDGIYVDIVSGEPLFASVHKYDSGTGWPSFYQPLEPDNIVEKKDRKLFVVRTEVRSKNGDSHLGHVFSDGPTPTGLRYCINSAALRFIPKRDLEKEGYGNYLNLFDE